MIFCLLQHKKHTQTQTHTHTKQKINKIEQTKKTK